uniref:mediator of RNA polymerase II transcription subunit 10 n=1 Tax=Ictidomys tridecemlineatus TaxID=43179 RepID=UPI00038C4FFC|nr:mediator of RNA polymerase II transcription subunit 10 [Ictidomys tridecemlineatus]
MVYVKRNFLVSSARCELVPTGSNKGTQSQTNGQVSVMPSTGQVHLAAAFCSEESKSRNFIVTGLQDIDKCRQQLHDITVPLEVFEYIDQGRNPQLYTKECLERALAKNEQVKGKIDTMKKFKSLLIQELSKVFPEDMAKYRSIRGEDHPPS